MHEIVSKFCCRVENTRVYVDSTGTELTHLLKGQPKYKIRGLLTDTQLYVWPSFDLTHHQMTQDLISDGYLDASEKPISIKLLLHDGQVEIFTYGKFLDRIVRNPVVHQILKKYPKTQIFEM